MKKKFKKSIITLHKEAKHNVIGYTINKDIVVLEGENGTKYRVLADRSWRKLNENKNN